MQFDFTTIMALIGPFIPFLLTLFPGLNAILKLIPKPVWLACVKAVDPGATITWSVPAAVRRDQLEARRAALLGRITAGMGTPGDDQMLANVNNELATLPVGGILDTLKSNPMLILAIVGGIIFFVTQKGGGCNKPAPAAPAKPAVSNTNPFGGHPLARAQ